MHMEYIKNLTQCLEAVQIYNQQGMPFTGYSEAMQGMVGLFSKVKKQGKQVFFIGNGGRKTYSLYDTSVTTCMGNDYGYGFIFSRPLEFLGNDGDLLVAISSSGNSQNIVNAIQAAECKGMRVITFSGFQRDNKISSMGRYNVYVPSSKYGIVESIHNIILQQIVDTVMERDGECL